MSSVTPTGSLLGNVSYKLTSPLIEVDATGGTTLVDNNVKFNTNVPLDKAIAITEVDWIRLYQAEQTPPSGTQTTSWAFTGQLTEALARTAPTLADNVDVDVFQEQVSFVERQDTAAGDVGWVVQRDNIFRHVFRHPWLTVAQQLNLIGEASTTEQNTQNGPEITFGVRIYFQLVDLDTNLRNYLATRIQIAGQA